MQKAGQESLPYTVYISLSRFFQHNVLEVTKLARITYMH